jgi:hypothetical protein
MPPDATAGVCAAGFIDLRRMREYDALCLDLVPSYSSAKIRALRARHKLSQGGVCVGAEHQPVHGAAVGDRGEAAEWAVA